MSQPLSIPTADLGAARLRALVEAAPAAAVVLAGDWLYPNPAARALLARLDIDTGSAPLAAALPAAAALAVAAQAALQAGGRGEVRLAGQQLALAARAAGERLLLLWLTPAAQAAWQAQERQHLQTLEERLRLAGEVGLDVQRAREILESDAHAADVRALERHYQQLGISAVPSMIIDDRHLIQGGQPPDVIERALRELAGQQATG
jgi:hypothetical protein